MCDLMTNDPANGPIVHVSGPLAVEEDPLQYSRRELDGVLDGRVKCVDHSGVAMADPVIFVNNFPRKE